MTPPSPDSTAKKPVSEPSSSAVERPLSEKLHEGYRCLDCGTFFEGSIDGEHSGDHTFEKQTIVRGHIKSQVKALEAKSTDSSNAALAAKLRKIQYDLACEIVPGLIGYKGPRNEVAKQLGALNALNPRLQEIIIAVESVPETHAEDAEDERLKELEAKIEKMPWNSSGNIFKADVLTLIRNAVSDSEKGEKAKK